MKHWKEMIPLKKYKNKMLIDWPLLVIQHPYENISQCEPHKQTMRSPHVTTKGFKFKWLNDFLSVVTFMVSSVANTGL